MFEESHVIKKFMSSNVCVISVLKFSPQLICVCDSFIVHCKTSTIAGIGAVCVLLCFGHCCFNKEFNFYIILLHS